MRKHTVCIDFDGTIVEHLFPSIGALKPNVIEAITKLHKKYEIVISSCRASKMFNPNGPGTSKAYLEMVQFLQDVGIPYDRIDDGTEGKVVAIAYIDDRAINFNDNWESLGRII